MSKKIALDDQHFAFQIWDTAGQEKVHLIRILKSLNIVFNVLIKAFWLVKGRVKLHVFVLF